MKLIFIYGPPATGKLTVANELSKITGYKVFHNHLTVDLIKPIFEFASMEFSKYNSKFRLELFEAAAKAKVPGLISTFVFADEPKDKRFVSEVVKVVERHNGKVLFVNLICKKEELYKRVGNKSRRAYGKINRKSLLNKSLKKWKLFSTVPKHKSLVIDNSNITAKKVAGMIKKHYSL